MHKQKDLRERLFHESLLCSMPFAAYLDFSVRMEIAHRAPTG